MNKPTDLKKELEKRGVTAYQVIKKMETKTLWKQSEWYRKISGDRSLSWEDYTYFIDCANTLVDTKKFDKIKQDDVAFIVKRIILV